MSFQKERQLKAIGSQLWVTQGEKGTTPVLGFGFADDPLLVLPEADLLSSPLLKQWEVDSVDFSSSENQTIEKMLGHIEKELGEKLDPVPAYEFVKSCVEAGYNIERDGGNIAYWILEQLQDSARSLVPVSTVSVVKRRRQSVP